MAQKFTSLEEAANQLGISKDRLNQLREAGEVRTAVEKLDVLKERAKNVVVEGAREFNPGWHLALDLRNMLLVSEATAKAALIREESRGGHTRDDFPTMDANWRKQLLVCNSDGTDVTVTKQEQIPMRPDLMELFELDEKQAAAQIRRVARVVGGWRRHFAGCGVTPRDLDLLAEQIDRPFLAEQRRDYE